MGKSKTGGGVGTNQHRIKGTSKARAKAASRRPAVPADPDPDDMPELLDREQAIDGLRSLAGDFADDFDIEAVFDEVYEYDPRSGKFGEKPQYRGAPDNPAAQEALDGAFQRHPSEAAEYKSAEAVLKALPSYMWEYSTDERGAMNWDIERDPANAHVWTAEDVWRDLDPEAWPIPHELMRIKYWATEEDYAAGEEPLYASEYEVPAGCCCGCGRKDSLDMNAKYVWCECGWSDKREFTDDDEFWDEVRRDKAAQDPDWDVPDERDNPEPPDVTDRWDATKGYPDLAVRQMLGLPLDYRW
jgi:hypothetical protein